MYVCIRGKKVKKTKGYIKKNRFRNTGISDYRERLIQVNYFYSFPAQKMLSFVVFPCQVK